MQSYSELTIDHTLTALIATLLNPPTGLTYVSDECTPILNQYLNACIQYATTNPLDVEKTTRMRLKNQLKRACTDFMMEQSKAHALWFINEEPAIVHHIEQYALQQGTTHKIMEIQGFFTQKSSDELRALLPPRLNQLYTQCIQLKKELASLTMKLDYLMRVKSKRAFEPLAITIVEPIGLSADALSTNDLVYNIKTTSHPMGYAVTMMLNLAYDAATLKPFDESTPYNGALRFTLGAKEFSALVQYIGSLYQNRENFELVFSSFLGEDASRYLYTGQKPLFEEIAVQKERQQHSLRPEMMTSRIMPQLSVYPNDTPVLLIGMVTIDLTDHPNREQLRTSLEQLYEKHQLKSGRGTTKTFLRTVAGLEFTSSLTPSHIGLILHDCIAYAHLANEAQRFGFSSWADDGFLKRTPEQPTPIAAYHRLLLEKLSGYSFINSLIKARQYFKPLPNNATHFSAVDALFNEALGQALNDAYSLAYQPASTSEHREISPQQLCNLLGRSDIPSDTSVICPRSNEEIQTLERALTSSPLIQHAEMEFRTYQPILAASNFPYSTLTQCIQALSDLLIARRNFPGTAHLQTNEYYGDMAVQLALRSWMHFVALVHYQVDACISDESILASFKTLCELMGSDDVTGCTKGLAGRITELLTVLAPKTDDEYVRADLDHRRDCAECVFRTHFTHGHESSMFNLVKTDAYHRIGLSQTRPLTLMTPDRYNLFRTEFEQKYHPASLYESFLSTTIQNIVTDACNNDDQDIYQRLHALAFVPNDKPLSLDDETRLDELFRFQEQGATRKWNISKIAWGLPEQLIKKFVTAGIFLPKTPNLTPENMFYSNTTTTNSTYSTSFGMER